MVGTRAHLAPRSRARPRPGVLDRGDRALARARLPGRRARTLPGPQGPGSRASGSFERRPKGPPLGIVVVDDGVLLGGFIALLAVRPEASGQGLGRALVEHVAARTFAARRWLYVSCDGNNAAALRFYRKLGFSRVGRLPDLVRAGRDGDSPAQAGPPTVAQRLGNRSGAAQKFRLPLPGSVTIRGAHDRPAIRELPRDFAARGGRNGSGLPGGAPRHRPPRRGQGAAQELHPRREPADPVPQRGARRQRHPPPQHHRDPRLGDHRRRHAVPGDGAARGREPGDAHPPRRRAAAAERASSSATRPPRRWGRRTRRGSFTAISSPTTSSSCRTRTIPSASGSRCSTSASPSCSRAPTTRSRRAPAR